MILKLGWKDLKRTPLINILIILLLIIVFITAITIGSAIQIKFKKYSALAPYMKQKGVYIESSFLQSQNGENISLLKDEKEVKEYLPNVKSVLSVEKVWEMFVDEPELPVNVWCYSEEVTKALSTIVMENGRWFNEEDKQDDILKAVVTYNKKGLNVGDIITLKTGIDNVEAPVEIIGMIKNDESLYFNNILGERYEDYRDCYYTYDYELEEEEIVMILSDAQILSGESSGKFKELNYRLMPKGFQKEMTGGTMLTYNENTSQKEIQADVDRLMQCSSIYKVYNLEEMNANSIAYVLKELKDYFPVFLCVFIFVIIAAISVNAITVKKQLKNYAVYYICGLSWKKCARISFCSSAIIAAIAFVLVSVSITVLNLCGVVDAAVLHLGILEVCIMLCISIFYVLLAWFIPLGIVRKTSAKEIMIENH